MGKAPFSINRFGHSHRDSVLTRSYAPAWEQEKNVEIQRTSECASTYFEMLPFWSSKVGAGSSEC